MILSRSIELALRINIDCRLLLLVFFIIIIYSIAIIVDATD